MKSSTQATRAHLPARPSVAPLKAQAKLQRGNQLLQRGRLREALEVFSKTLDLHPHYPEAINSMGCTLAALGEHPKAIVCYARSLSLWPENVQALSNMAASLQALGQTTEAIESLHLAIRLNPGYTEAHVHLSNLLFLAGRYPEAIEACTRALTLRPQNLEPILNGGSALRKQGRLAEAAALFSHAAAHCPNDPRYLLNLGETRRDQGRIAEAIAACQGALAIQPAYAAAYSNLLYTHAFARDISPAEELQLARGWEKATVPEPTRLQAAARRAAFPRTPRHGRPLRLGVVSAELGTHAVAEFLEPLLTHLDRRRFHLTLFPTTNRTGPRASRLRALADSLVPLTALPDDDATQLIRRHAIDLLLDTSGHTSGNRLGIFARRAAPVQCTYIGYWSTTGLTEMDWFLSDPDAPDDAAAGFSEGLWRLPRLAVCYHGDTALNHRLWQPSPDGALRLGSFNRLAKIRTETLTLWAEVLRDLPQSRLILEDQGSHPAETHTRIRSTLQQLGVPPNRVAFIPYEHGHERHMSLYNTVDIALDTLPFNSGTTAFDALWMGVPLVTLDGNWIGGRMGASILRSLGRPEWVANTPAAFVRIIQKLAANPAHLQALRHNLRQEVASSPLCNAPSLAAALANAFESMYDQWLNPAPETSS